MSEYIKKEDVLEDLLDFEDALKILFTPLSSFGGKTMADCIIKYGLTNETITTVKSNINRMFTTELVFALNKDYYINNLETKSIDESTCSKCGKEIPTNICNDCWYGERELNNK